jgi:hypothetical protein
MLIVEVFFSHKCEDIHFIRGFKYPKLLMVGKSEVFSSELMILTGVRREDSYSGADLPDRKPRDRLQGERFDREREKDLSKWPQQGDR